MFYYQMATSLLRSHGVACSGCTVLKVRCAKVGAASAAAYPATSPAEGAHGDLLVLCTVPAGA